MLRFRSRSRVGDGSTAVEGKALRRRAAEPGLLTPGAPESFPRPGEASGGRQRAGAAPKVLWEFMQEAGTSRDPGNAARATSGTLRSQQLGFARESDSGCSTLSKKLAGHRQYFGAFETDDH